jgi:cellulose synthase/poly-beta-1,6-N-acetylglucosamine synthase-like glycosyltransferase
MTLGYVLLMLAYRMGWDRQKDFVLPPQYEPRTFISVIIPARNERFNIGGCIESLLAQKYPADLFEIIVIDDHSDDGTAEVVMEYAHTNVRCIPLAEHLDPDKKINAYKKAAIAAGIAQSNGTLIVTTDADCLAPNSWLLHIAAIYELERPVVVVAPVIFTSNDTILQLFQLTDFMSMQGITAAAHRLNLGNMSNGANFAFSKAAFIDAGGYHGIDHLASGDDLLLMMKLNKLSPDSISYLKSQMAIVVTTPQPDWGSFLQQRIRWSSKSGKYKDFRLTAILLFVYLYNLLFLVLGVACFFYPDYLYLTLSTLAIKIVAEYLFVRHVARFFNNEWVLKFFPFLQPLHIIYIVVAGFLGLIGSYKWKGRKVR